MLGSCGLQGSLQMRPGVDEAESWALSALTTLASSIIMIGEIHGSHEIPRAVRILASAALSLGRGVAIGLEMEVSEQAALESQTDVSSLLLGKHWHFEDGRASAAILDLVRFAQTHERCHLFCFDSAVPAPRGSPAHSRAMARAATPHVRQALEIDEVVLLLAGSAHCRTQRGATTLGTQLKQQFPSMMSLVACWPANSRVFSYDATDVRMPYGVRSVPATGPVAHGGGARVRLGGREGFDGRLEICMALSPSLPARRVHGVASTGGRPAESMGKNPCALTCTIL